MTDERDLLKSRAFELAKPDQSGKSEEGIRREMLEFMLSGEHYAMETTCINEAINILEMTPVPGTPAFLNGLINVRGRLIPVVSLKKFFLLKEEGMTVSTKALIIRNETYEVAVLTDAILPTLWVTESSIKPVPSNLQGIGAEHLLGITPEAIIIIDGGSLIAKIESSLTNHKESPNHS